jgi:hypothetical protein
MTAQSRLRTYLLMALTSDQAGETHTAIQKAKAEMAKNGHGDIHAIAEHIENIGKEIVPVGYVSQDELDQRLQAASREAMQKGREIERLSRGQTAINWYEVFLECRDHRQLYPGNETDMVNKWVGITQFDPEEPPDKVRSWVSKILRRPRI